MTRLRLGLQLGATAGELSASRLRAIDLELGRAALALEDLDEVRARADGRVAPARGRSTWAELVADSVEAWRPAASAPRGSS